MSSCRSSVIGQEETLRYVSVAIFKHLQGEKFGNLLLIGNSGTGKTTIMRGIEALYNAHQEFAEYRVVLIMNANTFATEEGAVDTSRLFSRLEERTRQVLGEGATRRADRPRHGARHRLPGRDRQGLGDDRRQALRHRHQHPAGRAHPDRGRAGAPPDHRSQRRRRSWNRPPSGSTPARCSSSAPAPSRPSTTRSSTASPRRRAASSSPPPRPTSTARSPSASTSPCATTSGRRISSSTACSRSSFRASTTPSSSRT